MSATRLLGDALDPLVAGRGKVRIVELGAGDGSLLLRLAKTRARAWPSVTLDLLDLQPVIAAGTLARYQELGWTVNVLKADVFDWLATTHVDADADTVDGPPIIIANLFLHHFEGQRLRDLLHGIAARARAFICVEPRRSRTALLGSHLLGAIGCNDVTRHDAVVSVRAGFSGRDLANYWPQDGSWDVREQPAGLFSHRFIAKRI